MLYYTGVIVGTDKVYALKMKDIFIVSIYIRIIVY